MGGVFTRFPELRIGFLEGGVAWAVSLLADVIGHWDKRHAGAIGSLDPAILDVDALMKTIGEYGDAPVHRPAGRASAQTSQRTPGRPANLDEFAAAGFSSVDDIIAIFSDRMFFGCEADDPLVGWATNARIKHRPVKLKPDPRHRHLALGRAGDERGDRRGVRVARRQGHRRRRLPRLHVREPGRAAQGRPTRLLRRHGLREGSRAV